MPEITIREIQQADNPYLAKIVKDTLAEFGANHPNTVYYDPTTDTLFELFQIEKAKYFVLSDSEESGVAADEQDSRFRNLDSEEVLWARCVAKFR